MMIHAVLSCHESEYYIFMDGWITLSPSFGSFVRNVFILGELNWHKNSFHCLHRSIYTESIHRYKVVVCSEYISVFHKPAVFISPRSVCVVHISHSSLHPTSCDIHPHLETHTRTHVRGWAYVTGVFPLAVFWLLKVDGDCQQHSKKLH